MDFDAFQQAFDELKKRDPFLFEDHDPQATSVELADTESQLGCRLSPKYAQFLRVYGGGGVGACMLFSVHQGSEWYIVDQNAACGWLTHNLLAFSPNGTGDYYLFRVRDGSADDEIVFYDHETGLLSGPEYVDVFEYILAMCC